MRTKHRDGLKEIRDTAKVFRWASDLQPGTLMMWRADHSIEVDVSITGLIRGARLYEFRSLNDLRLKQHAPDRHTKETILSWLAQ